MNSIAAGIGRRYEVEGIAHQPFGNVPRAVEQSANLQIDARTKLLGIGLILHRALCQGREEACRHPPERPSRPGFLCIFNSANRRQHVGQPAPILWITQPGKESPLETTALLTQEFMELLLRQLCRRRIASGRPRRQVGEKEIGRRDSRQTARCLDLSIDSEQAQRLVRLAIDQAIKVVADHGQGSMRKRNARGVCSEGPIFDRQQHRFQRFGKLRDAVESNDRQCALHLMQVRTTKADLRQVALTGL